MKNRLKILQEPESLIKDEFWTFYCRFLTPSGKTDRTNILPRSKDAGFYADFEPDVRLASELLSFYTIDGHCLHFWAMLWATHSKLIVVPFVTYAILNYDTCARLLNCTSPAGKSFFRPEVLSFCVRVGARAISM